MVTVDIIIGANEGGFEGGGPHLPSDAKIQVSVASRRQWLPRTKMPATAAAMASRAFPVSFSLGQDGARYFPQRAELGFSPVVGIVCRSVGWSRLLHPICGQSFINAQCNCSRRRDDKPHRLPSRITPAGERRSARHALDDCGLRAMKQQVRKRVRVLLAECG